VITMGKRRSAYLRLLECYFLYNRNKIDGRDKLEVMKFISEDLGITVRHARDILHLMTLRGVIEIRRVAIKDTFPVKTKEVVFFKEKEEKSE